MADKPRLLIVDDEDTILKLLTKLFAEDYEVITASTASDGLKSIEESPLDVVLLDIMLPDPTGLELLKAVKTVDPDTQVIMMTGYASIETSTEALREGAYDYILKPFEESQIKSLLRNALDKKKALKEKKDLLEELADLTQKLQEANDEFERTQANLVDARTRVDKKLEKKINELSKLNDLMRQLLLETDFTKLLELSIKMTVEATETTGGALMFSEVRSNQLFVKSSIGIDKLLPRGSRLPLSKSEFALVISQGKPLLVKFGKPEKILACSPLEGKSEKYGIICVVDRTDGGNFDESDLEFLSTISQATSIALQNSLLFNSLQKSYFEASLSLMSIEEALDKEMKEHSERVANLAWKLAYALSVPEGEISAIKYASMFHDIGKIVMPQGEYLSISEKIISPIRFLGTSKPIIRYINERWDGSGRSKLKGEKIPIGSRIIAVANAYDEYIYEYKFSPEEAEKKLELESGKTYDPKVLEALRTIHSK